MVLHIASSLGWSHGNRNRRRGEFRQKQQKQGFSKQTNAFTLLLLYPVVSKSPQRLGSKCVFPTAIHFTHVFSHCFPSTHVFSKRRATNHQRQGFLPQIYSQRLTFDGWALHIMCVCTCLCAQSNKPKQHII